MYFLLRLRAGHSFAGAALPAGEARVEAGESGTEAGRIQEPAVVEQRRRFAQGKILAVRVPDQVFGGEQFAQVFVAVEADAEHVVHFPLHEPCPRPEVGDGRQGLPFFQVYTEVAPGAAVGLRERPGHAEAGSPVPRVGEPVDAEDVGEHLETFSPGSFNLGDYGVRFHLSEAVPVIDEQLGSHSAQPAIIGSSTPSSSNTSPRTFFCSCWTA